MKCEQCGSEVRPDQKFCSNCGARQKHEEVWRNSQGQVQTIDGKISNRRIALILFCGLCVVFYGIKSADCIDYLMERVKYGLPLGPLTAILEAMSNIWMCVFLVLIAVKSTAENRKRFLICLGCGGGMLVIIRLFLMIKLAILNPRGYSYSRGNLTSTGFFDSVEFILFFRRFAITLMGAVVTVAGVYVLLRSISDAPSAMDGWGKSGGDMEYGRTSAHLKTDRSLLIYILLSIVTCGIYSLYFIYGLSRDMNIACEGDGGNTAGPVKLILMSFVTFGIYDLVWFYSLGERIAANSPRYGVDVQESGTTVLLWRTLGVLLFGVGPLVALYMIIKNTNMLCEGYNHQHSETFLKEML